MPGSFTAGSEHPEQGPAPSEVLSEQRMSLDPVDPVKCLRVGPEVKIADSFCVADHGQLTPYAMEIERTPT